MLANLKEPPENDNIYFLYFIKDYVAIRSALKFAIHRVVNHICIIFQIEILQFKVSVRDVTIRAQIKIELMKKGSQIPNMVKDVKNTY